MINSKIKAATQQTAEEKLFKELESINWKLWEIMNMMKDFIQKTETKTPKTKTRKTVEE